MGVAEIYGNVVKKSGANEAAKRHYHLFCARVDRVLTQEELNRICFAELDDIRKRGGLGFKPLPVIKTPQDRDSWRAVESSNESNKAWREDVHHFAADAGLQMSDKEKQWYGYITTGKVGNHVGSYLDRLPRKSVEQKAELDVPF
ncbi:MAG: hypothetical protein ACYTEO_17370 [Planctomycetota bacterium]|jgi:hypothetical protein